MADMVGDNFYEDDEPVAKILRDYEQGEHGVTQEPVRGRTEYLALPGIGLTPASANEASPGELVLR